jgi:hypothetical protein
MAQREPLQQMLTEQIQQGTQSLTEMQDQMTSVITQKAMNVVSAISGLAFTPSGVDGVAGAAS